jgi:hypothetical protein
MIRFINDNERIAMATNDHTIKLLNAKTGQELLTLKDHEVQDSVCRCSNQQLVLKTNKLKLELRALSSPCLSTQKTHRRKNYQNRDLF